MKWWGWGVARGSLGGGSLGDSQRAGEAPLVSGLRSSSCPSQALSPQEDFAMRRAQEGADSRPGRGEIWSAHPGKCIPTKIPTVAQRVKKQLLMHVSGHTKLT